VVFLPLSIGLSNSSGKQIVRADAYGSLLIEAARITSGRLKEDDVKNLKDLWEKLPELVDGIGGEQLAASGFEYDQPETEFLAPDSGEEGKE
jgi:hypothetical protein